MKMKKITALALMLCFLISLIGIPSALAEGEPALLFDMDLSEFEKGEAGTSWGIKNNGTSTTVTIKANDGESAAGTSTGSISLESYTNSLGETISYVNYDQTILSGAQTGTNSCNRIWIEDTSWANEEITAELWLKAEPTGSTDYLLRFYGETDDDRASFDRAVSFNLTAGGTWQTQTTLSSGSNAVTSATNPSNGEWVHVAISKGLNATTNVGSINIYVNGTQIRTNLSMKAVTETTAGLLLGTFAQKTVDTAPNNFGVASAKIYEGALTKAQITAHYEEEAENFKPLLCKGTAYAEDESFMVDLTDITDDVPDTEQGSLTLNGDKIEAEFSYDEETKKLTVTPCDYLLGGSDYMLSFGSSLSGVIRVEVKTSRIVVEDVSYTDGAIDYVITGDGTERQIMVLAVG